jgi:hypothetical protein
MIVLIFLISIDDENELIVFENIYKKYNLFIYLFCSKNNEIKDGNLDPHLLIMNSICVV